MSAEKLSGSLGAEFVGLVSQYATNTQYTTFAKNMEERGLTEWLADRAPQPDESAWGGFTAVTDEIVDGTVEAVDAEKQKLDVTIECDSRPVAKELAQLMHISWAGIPPDADPPFIWPTKTARKITIEGLRYADWSTLGREGSTTLYQAQESTSVADAVRFATAEELSDPTILGMLSEPLAARVEYQRNISPSSYVSSGRLAIVGAKLRDALAGSTVIEENPKAKKQTNPQFTIQRPYGSTPKIEERTKFFTSDDDIPLSVISLGQLLGKNFGDRMQDLKKPYKERDFSKVIEDLYDIATGLGVTQGGGMMLRAIMTLSGATYNGVKTMTSERLHRPKH